MEENDGHNEGHREEHAKAPVGEKRRKTVKFKLAYLVAAVVAVAAIAAVYFLFLGGNAGAAVVVSGDNVSVYYTGSFVNGTVFDSNFGGTPLNFVVDSGNMIPGFNNAVIGMKVGQTKNVTVTPDEAYGYYNSSLVFTVNASVFGNETIHDGEPVSNGFSYGIITAINGTKMNSSDLLSPAPVVNGSALWGNDTTITVDFNSPLAGDTLDFEIQVVAINK